MKLENKYLSTHKITKGTYRHTQCTTTWVACNQALHAARNKERKEDPFSLFLFPFLLSFPMKGLLAGYHMEGLYGNLKVTILLSGFLGTDQGHCIVYFGARHLTHTVLLFT